MYRSGRHDDGGRQHRAENLPVHLKAFQQKKIIDTDEKCRPCVAKILNVHLCARWRDTCARRSSCFGAPREIR